MLTHVLGEGNLHLAELLHPPLVPPPPERKGCSHSLSLQLISKSGLAGPLELIVPLISLLLGHADMHHWYQFQRDVGDCGKKGERADQTESDLNNNNKKNRKKRKEALFDEAEKFTMRESTR